MAVGEAETSVDLGARLLALLDHLGIGRAHFATQMPGDIAALVNRDPDRVGGIVLCAPARLDPAPFTGLADRIFAIGPTRQPDLAIS